MIVGTTEWYEEIKHLPTFVFKTYPYFRGEETANIDFYFPITLADKLTDEDIMPVITELLNYKCGKGMFESEITSLIKTLNDDSPLTKALINIKQVIGDDSLFEQTIIRNIKPTKNNFKDGFS